MAELPDSQKKISKSYSGNLGYFRRPHYLRRLRSLSFYLAIAVSVAFALSYGKWGSSRAFSTGPLSQNHAHLQDRCDTCHTGWDGKNEAAFAETLAKFSTTSALESLDVACMKCHPGTNLHAPQLWNASLAAASPSSPVHASSCASCHREHAGPHRMALPSSQTCTDCHGSTSKLQEARSTASPAKGGAQTAQTPSKPTSAKLPVPTRGDTVDLGDGLLVYLPPTDTAPELKTAFESFAHGHPSFGYERPGAQDPSDLKFNHARHFRSDIPKLNNAKLDCATCHQPEANGMFMQPVRYEKHCQECHSLQIQQSLPNLHIPHGDSKTVSFFLAGLDASLEASVRASGTTEPIAIAERVKEEREAMQRRGLFSVRDLEKRVFLEGDPRGLDEERLMRSGKPKFLTECAKCHTVKVHDDGAPPDVQLTNTPKRWLAKGAFNHAPHKQSACTDCHGAATKSKLTSDILLPTQQSCAECHQPIVAGKPGVKFSCDNCHHFHSNVTPPALEASFTSPFTPDFLQP
jgi:mono/diheme cytochrome c family protein